jgi:hypothetical protein
MSDMSNEDELLRKWAPTLADKWPSTSEASQLLQEQQLAAGPVPANFQKKPAGPTAPVPTTAPPPAATPTPTPKTTNPPEPQDQLDDGDEDADQVGDDDGDDLPHTGVMVAYFLDPEDASDLALEDGEDPSELHLTLAYLGQVGDGQDDLGPEDEDQILGAVKDWAAGQPPITAKVGGIGVFKASPPVTYASVDGQHLPAGRQDLVNHLSKAGYTLSHPTMSVTTLSPPVPMPEPVKDDTAKAFVTEANGRTLITAPAAALEKGAVPSLSLADITDKAMLWMSGRFVGAEVPNRNGALWSAGDLQMSTASVVNGPLNWLHESRHVIGTLAKADYVGAAQQADANGFSQPHINATAAIWRWIYPDEAYVVQQASDFGQLWYSMECISRDVTCAGPSGCGNTTSYEQYMAGAACEHVKERASVRQFVKPVFLGGAVIVPPARPGWAEADASVMGQATKLAEAAYEQAGSPDVSAATWEQLMAQVLLFAQR